MTFETIAYIPVPTYEKEFPNGVFKISDSAFTKYAEDGDTEIWVEAEEDVVDYLLSKGYLNKQEALEILDKAEIIVMY